MVRSGSRERILEAARVQTAASGWASVTMGGLAEDVGVSRQTVYNEFGSKPALAESMIFDELERFLEEVKAAYERHAEDACAGVRESTLAVLRLAQEDPLLKAIVTATHGADTELLPLLTTHAEPLLTIATAVVRDQLAHYPLGLTPDQLDATADMLVRTVLSHVMASPASPAQTAGRVAWIFGRVTGR